MNRDRRDRKKPTPGLAGVLNQLFSELEADHQGEREPQGDSVAELLDRMGQLARKYTPASEEETHDHIRSMAPNIKAQLDQLKTLKQAGLYTEKEYEDKRRKILKGL